MNCGGSRSRAAPFLGLAILLSKLCRQTAEDREDGEKAELEVKADMQYRPLWENGAGVKDYEEWDDMEREEQRSTF